MAFISIPKNWMGVTLQEPIVKARLRLLQPDLHFDLGVRLNIWHPFRETRQSVFYLGKFITAMDRGTLPEVPVWSTRRDLVEVDLIDVRINEIALRMTKGVRIECKKCWHCWIVPVRPMGVVGCPALCENIALATDLKCFGFEDVPTGKALVKRKVNDRVILVGWRHTLGMLVKAGIPGLTKPLIERTFGITLNDADLLQAEVVESGEADFLNRVVEVA